MKLLSAWAVAAGLLAVDSILTAKDLPCPNLQLMQEDWLGDPTEAMAAAKKALPTVNFTIASASTSSVRCELGKPKAEGWILISPKSETAASLAIIALANSPMDAVSAAQSIRNQMEKTPVAGRQVQGTYSGIWVQDAAGEAEVEKLHRITTVLSFTWNGPPDQAGVVAERGLREMGFKNIQGGGINHARAGTKEREQLTAIVTYAPIDDASATVHVLVSGYGDKDKATGYCRDLRSIIQYDSDNNWGQAAGNLTVDEVVEKAMKLQKLPGLAIGILKKNSKPHIEVFGLAQGYEPPDQPSKNPPKKVPVTAKTVFRCGSVIKTMTAMAALKLMEEGKMDLDAPVQKYVPDFPKKTSPKTGEPVTITPRQLLCHQSGLPHYAGSLQDKPLPLDKNFIHEDKDFTFDIDSENPHGSLEKFASSDLMFPPGTRMHYSSYGYMLLGDAIQSASGVSFDEALRHFFITPLSLTSLKSQHHAGPAQPGHAEGYARNINTGYVQVRTAVDAAWKTGAGGYSLNIEDLTTWADALLHKKFLKPETYKMAWTIQRTNINKKTNWGLGFEMDESPAKLFNVAHGGLADIATAELMLYPDKEEGVVILCNCNYAQLVKLANDIHDAATTPKSEKK